MNDSQLMEGVNVGDKLTFELLYKKYYVYLCLIAEHITRSNSDAEEIVSDVFVKLWNNRQNININNSIKLYLVRAVQNTSINYLEKSKNGSTSNIDAIPHELLAWENDYPLGNLYEKEMLVILEKGISSLPDNCREIFLLSRNSDLSYAEISAKLGISVNTVKTQMKIAIARLRDVLKDYLHIVLFFLSFNFF